MIKSCGGTPRKGAKMAYKKPQMVAKSSAKKSYVAGCPERTPSEPSKCYHGNSCCYCGPLD